jgi:hypothetical protein
VGKWLPAVGAFAALAAGAAALALGLGDGRGRIGTRPRRRARPHWHSASATGAAALALGLGDFLIPLIGFLAFIVLQLRYPGCRHPDLGGLTGPARLVIAGSWLALVAYLSVVFFLTAGWLD